MLCLPRLPVGVQLLSYRANTCFECVVTIGERVWVETSYLYVDSVISYPQPAACSSGPNAMGS